jgi:hypothetical protein
LTRKLSHPVLGRSQRSSGGSLLGPNIAPDFRRRASLRWLRCDRTALRPRQDRVVDGELDALPAKAGSASAAAIIKDKVSIAAIFRSTLNTSYLHYAIIAQRHAQVLCPLCVAFNEEIVQGGDLFPS